jgi:hypothetical protein
MNITNLTPQQIRQAADLKERIDGLAEELNAILGGGETSTPVAAEESGRPTNGRRKRRGRLSAQGRANIAAAARARWAALRMKKKGVASAQAGSAPAPAGKKLHWTQTPEGKARLARLIKQSWRKRRA